MACRVFHVQMNVLLLCVFLTTRYLVLQDQKRYQILPVVSSGVDPCLQKKMGDQVQGLDAGFILEDHLQLDLIVCPSIHTQRLPGANNLQCYDNETSKHALLTIHPNT